MRVTFTLNNVKIVMEAEPMDILSKILRHKGYVSITEYCNTGRCGGCTVLKNGFPVPACSIHMFSVENSQILTFEYIKETHEYEIIDKALTLFNCNFCEFCRHGRIVTIYSIMKRISLMSEEQFKHFNKLSDEEIYHEVSSNICSCTELNAIMAAIKYVVKITCKQRRKAAN